MISVLVPSFSDDLLEQLFASMEQSEPDSVRRVIVGDNGLSAACRARWPQARYVSVPSDPFCAPQAFNLCAAVAGPVDDIVLLNDDLDILTPNWAQRAEALATAWPSNFGVLAFNESTAVHGAVVESARAGAFIGAVIPRHIWDRFPWDERYTGYGFEDTDFCLQLWHAGYKVGVTDAVTIRHTGTVGYMRRLGSWDAVQIACNRSFEAFYAKWGIPIPEPRRIEAFLAADHLNRARCTCVSG